MHASFKTHTTDTPHVHAYLNRCMRVRFRFLLADIALLVSLMMLSACSTVEPISGPPPETLRHEIERRIPASTEDRAGWAADIQSAMTAQRLQPNVENICAVLAVIEQETGYRANPAVPDLPRIARREIDRRAAALHVPGLLVETGLKMKAADGERYADKLAAVRTERDLSRLYEDIIDRIPLGQRLFSGKNPVQTGGAMQVGIPFAESHARNYPYPVATTIREEVFTRRGGVYFGMLHLLGYDTPYTRKIHRFADYNAGWYASRNAAFQNAVAIATGTRLVLDGDLLAPGAPMDKPGQTERAVRTLSSELHMDAQSIRQALSLADSLAFNDSVLFRRVFSIAQQRAGKPLPEALIPNIRLNSPKITRELTTEWFANRVDGRYRNCLNR